MEPISTFKTGRCCSSYGKLVAITLILVAIVSPLYVDRRVVFDSETEEEAIDVASWLPLLLLVVLILAIAVSLCLDRNFTRFDPYWIHRVGGSSTGIIVVLLILALILKCKASVMSLDG